MIPHSVVMFLASSGIGSIKICGGVSVRHWHELGEGEYWGASQVAEYLRKSSSSIQRYIKAGYLVPDAVMPSNRDGKSGRRKFKKSTVVAFEHKIWEACEKGCSLSVVCGCTK